MQYLDTFTAHIQSGSGRGKHMGTPTLNLDLNDVPRSLKEGIYACFAVVDAKRYQAAMHYGPRPVHNDSRSCEVHLLDVVLKPEPQPEPQPQSLTVEVIAYLRPVLNFPSEAALIAQIADDIAQARGILAEYDAASKEARS